MKRIYLPFKYMPFWWPYDLIYKLTGYITWIEPISKGGVFLEKDKRK